MENLKSKKFVCGECNQDFTRNDNLKNHVKKFHPKIKVERCNKILGFKCPLCHYSGKVKIDFYTHVESIHDIHLSRETINIHKTDFDKWKMDIEKELNSRFVVESGSKKNSYKCHRAGHFISRGKGSRRLKKQGSNKIDGFCPAGFKVIKDEQCQLTINLIKTHVGHQCDLGRLSLTSSERQILATKIASNIPFNVILDEVRDSVSCSSQKRLHLLTRKDLKNIEASFNLQASATASNSRISDGRSMGERRHSLWEKFAALMKSVQTEEQVKHVEQWMRSLESTIEDMNKNQHDYNNDDEETFNVPHNIKIKTQKSALIKKTKTKGISQSVVPIRQITMHCNC